MNYRPRNLAYLAVLTSCISTLHAQVLINEFMYDDTGTDDREFVELYNAGLTPVDIGGWTLGGRDSTTTNPTVVITPGTMLAPGDYYVIGNTGVLNVDQVVGANTFENDNETLELTDTAATLIDAVLYEASTNVGGPIPLSAPLIAQIGTPYWGGHSSSDIAGSPLNTFTSVSRYNDGRDTNNNGRDFFMRPSTPGTANYGTTYITTYNAPNVDVLADGTVAAGMTGSFVKPRAFTPGVATAGLNPNAIPAPVGLNKAIIAWDQSGGGNGSVSEQLFADGGNFSIQVYLDTENLPISTNASGVPFRGSEQTFFGIGTIDGLSGLANVSGLVGIAAGNLGQNGATGVHWYYEKIGVSTAGGTNPVERLYLIDAGDGGPNNASGTNGSEWLVLAEIDLTGTFSGWHTLSLSIAPNGQGVATYDTQTFNFTTTAGLAGEFSIGYRENTQDGATTVPSYLRPATYAAIPEPGAFGLLALAASIVGIRRRRSARNV
jgi:hypothetical protein